jgi:Putative Actinobacterial Holin-X, holin superfamily III
MLDELVALAKAQAKTAARRIAVPAAFAVVAGLFALFAMAALFVALFCWLEPEHGPAVAALVCAGAAIVLAILALLPLAFRRRPAPQPPPEGALSQFVTLMAKTAPGLGPRQIVVAAALLGAALALTARRNRK